MDRLAGSLEDVLVEAMDDQGIEGGGWDPGYPRVVAIADAVREHVAKNDLLYSARDVEMLVDERTAELQRENDKLHEDLVRLLTQRKIALQRAAAHVIPGPDGQDDIDRQRLIDEWIADGWDETDSWQELAAKGAEVIADRDRLATEVERLRAENAGS